MPGRRVEKRLSAAQVKSLQTSGKYEDGGGLRLIVGDTRAKRWVLRVSINGKRLERGLGSFPAVSLEEARIKAGEIRKVAKTGIDMRDEARRRTSFRTTFRHMFEISFAQRERQLSNGKHLRQWPATMEAYVFPKIGNVPVAEVTAAQVLDVLTPIWFEKPETAKRVLQRMETVFKSAIVRGIRERASPCVGVAKELGPKHRQVRHHASMSWKDIPNFLARIRVRSSRRRPMTILALEFLVLTATRSGETRNARWNEFDLAAALWVIPKERMKARITHRVPLSPRCLAILQQARRLRPESDLVFEASRHNHALSDMTLTKLLRDLDLHATPHGFRSSFKVWCAEVAKAANEVSEAALAHGLPSKVAAAYLRTDFLDERRWLMDHLAAHCTSEHWVNPVAEIISD